MNTAQAIAVENPAASFEPRLSFTEEISFSGAKPDTNLGYFYALIAMTCVYGSYWGIRNTMHLQADQSPQGARRYCTYPQDQNRPIRYLSRLGDYSWRSVASAHLCSLRLWHQLRRSARFDPLDVTCRVSVWCCSRQRCGNLGAYDENLKYAVLLIANLTLSFLAVLCGHP